VAFDPAMLADLARRKVALVWSPRSNLALYGRTLDFETALKLHIPLALGTDWLPSGSMTMPREAACAMDYAASRGRPLSSRQVWTMMTANAAKAVHMEGLIGSIVEGARADLILVDNRGISDPYLGVALAAPQRIAAVMRGGKLLAGDAELLAPFGGDCEALEMAGRRKLACLAGDGAPGYSALKAKADAAGLWPAFFEGKPPVEPPCREAPSTQPGGGG
jgi:cytosine/adenosine deaminase-related metal-dependent hydrolase